MIMRYLTLGGLGTILALAAGVWYFQGRAETNAIQAAQARQEAEQYKAAVTAYADHFNATVDTYNGRMGELQEEYRNASEVADSLSELLSKHDLAALAFSKPDLVERSINDGTRRVFDDLAAVTATLTAESNSGTTTAPEAGNGSTGDMEDTENR